MKGRHMVKFLVTKRDGGLIIGLGITEKNVEALKKDLPIMVKMSEIPLPQGVDLAKSNIMIFYGATEESISASLAEFISSGTTIIDERVS